MSVARRVGGIAPVVAVRIIQAGCPLRWPDRGASVRRRRARVAATPVVLPAACLRICKPLRV
eukprot:4814129-Prymnesium_polylepis.1